MPCSSHILRAASIPVHPALFPKAFFAPSADTCHAPSEIVTSVRAPSSTGSNSKVVVVWGASDAVPSHRITSLRGGSASTSLTTGRLCGLFPELDRTTVLQHLRVLERAELVTGRRVGKERQLALAPLPIKRIHDRWISGYAEAAVELIERLSEEEV